jgi:hypothetical protein
VHLRATLVPVSQTTSLVETRPLTVSTKGRRRRPLSVVYISPSSLPLCASQVRHSAILPRERVLCIEENEGRRRSEESGSTHRRSDPTISSKPPTPGLSSAMRGKRGQQEQLVGRSRIHREQAAAENLFLHIFLYCPRIDGELLREGLSRIGNGRA